MFKSFKARKCVRQALAFVLSFVMVMSNIQVANVSAAESSAAEKVTYSVGEWTAVDGGLESRTSSWDFTTA